ncbi:MAG TPA: threonine/serine exporter family protein, partial [Candidatus Binatia bacterium]|nr:threonine/serine exporter family protein [Candidatus Binatia bacterium]
MAPSPGAPTPTTPAPLDAATVRRVLAVARRAGAMLLASGAQTTDVELAIAEMSADLGLAGVQVNVTFSSISLSYVERGDLAPTTVIQLVRDRSADFTRLADVAALKNDIAARRVDLTAAEAALDRIEQDDQRFPAWLALVAPAVSAAATAFLFGGGALDAAATLVVAILVQPLLGALARTGIPPFFTLLLGTTLATLLAAGTVWLGLPVAAPVVLTASLLRFLPGAALVSGIRDLIDQSVVSGTARLAEAILVGAGVASGAALGIAIASQPGVQLELHPEGANEYVLALAMVAAGVAVAGYAVQLSVPTFAIPWTAALGAMAWAIFTT